MMEIDRVERVDTCRSCRLGGESDCLTQDAPKKAKLSEGSRTGEAERTSYIVAKWPQGAASAKFAQFL